jgi:hypothetical protein
MLSAFFAQHKKGDIVLFETKMIEQLWHFCSFANLAFATVSSCRTIFMWYTNSMYAFNTGDMASKSMSDFAANKKSLTGYKPEFRKHSVMAMDSVTFVSSMNNTGTCPNGKRLQWSHIREPNAIVSNLHCCRRLTIE